MLIWHYTSIEVIIEILKNDSLLLASHISFLNDFHEGQFASEHLISYLHQQLAWGGDMINEEEIMRLEPYLRQGVYRPRFVLCFSKLRDDLSQWRAYAPDGGIAIGFDFDELKKHLICPVGKVAKYDLRECNYLSALKEEELFSKISEQTSEFDKRSTIDHYEKEEDNLCRQINQQAFDALFWKNEAFSAEQEVRYGIMYDGFYHYEDSIIIKGIPRVPIYLNKPLKQLIKEIIISPHKSGKNELLVNILRLQAELDFEITKSNLSYTSK